MQFLNSVLEADPIKTVIAKEPAQNARRSPSNTSKTREKKVRAASHERCTSVFGKGLFTNPQVKLMLSELGWLSCRCFVRQGGGQGLGTVQKRQSKSRKDHNTS